MASTTIPPEAPDRPASDPAAEAPSPVSGSSPARLLAASPSAAADGASAEKAAANGAGGSESAAAGKSAEKAAAAAPAEETGAGRAEAAGGGVSAAGPDASSGIGPAGESGSAATLTAVREGSAADGKSAEKVAAAEVTSAVRAESVGGRAVAASDLDAPPGGVGPAGGSGSVATLTAVRDESATVGKSAEKAAAEDPGAARAPGAGEIKGVGRVEVTAAGAGEIKTAGMGEIKGVVRAEGTSADRDHGRAELAGRVTHIDRRPEGKSSANAARSDKPIPPVIETIRITRTHPAPEPPAPRQPAPAPPLRNQRASAYPTGGSPPVRPEPLPASVYWRRRVVALVVGLMIIALVAWVLHSAFAGSAPAPSPSPAAASSGLTSSSAGTGTAAGTSEAAGTSTGTGAAAGTGTAGTGTAPGPGIAAGTGTAAGNQSVLGPCPAGAVVLSLFSSQSSYAIRQTPQFDIDVVSTATGTCTFDIGAKHVLVQISAAGKQVWSSSDCAKGQASVVTHLRRGVPTVVPITWDGHHSSPGCPVPGKPAAAGTYSATASAGSVVSNQLTFRVG